MVKETAPENVPSRYGIVVASAHCTRTFEFAVRRPSERANSRSTSMQLRLLHRHLSQSVVKPGPGPTSRTSLPKSTPRNDHGRTSFSSFCFHWADRQYHRCIRFILHQRIIDAYRARDHCCFKLGPRKEWVLALLHRSSDRRFCLREGRSAVVTPRSTCDLQISRSRL